MTHRGWTPKLAASVATGMSECRKQIAEGWTPPHKYGGQWIRLLMDSLDCCRDGGSTRVRLLGTMVGVVEFTHLPSELEIAAWPTFTPERPLELLVSACLTGAPCGVDGTSYNAPYAHTGRLLHLPNVHVLAFCPEDFAFGTPRATPDIHGGTGFDVLDGTARVLSDTGEDWTAEMLGVAETMLRVAQKNDVHLALLMDISAACGSQVIYDGPRSEGRHQAGQGVCAALLIRHGVKVLSHRDHRTLDAVLSKLDPAYQVDPAALDHHETLWYVETFGSR